MNTQGVISINPTGTPAGIHISNQILTGKSIVRKPISALRQTARLLLGVTTSASDSRRQWTFRLVVGAILMCFGLLFLDSTVISDPSEYVGRGISIAMISGGAMIACGLLTRIVAFALSIILATFALHISLATMTGYVMLVCIAACVAGAITGSGRYSLDTLIYNSLLRREKNCAF